MSERPTRTAPRCGLPLSALRILVALSFLVLSLAGSSLTAQAEAQSGALVDPPAKTKTAPPPRATRPATGVLGPLWDSAWRAGREGDSGVWDLEGAIASAPRVPGLSEEDATIVASEIALRRLYEDATAIGRPDRALALVEEFLRTPHHPSVEGPARHLLGILRHLAGDPEGARREWSSLGFVTDVQLIGPFENERGSGFSAEYEPERTIDLTATQPGKRGPIEWRRFEGMGLAGQIELGELVHPASEALAYLVTWIEVPEETDAVLRVGSTGAYKLWLGDREVASLDVERPIRLDQDAHAVRLHAGRNRLRILSGQTKGNWAFRLRVTNHAGTPLPGMTISAVPPSDPNDVPSFDHVREGNPDLGARSRLDRVEFSMVRAALLGWLHHEVHAHDRNDHPDREEIRYALESIEESATADHALLEFFLATSYTQEIGHAAEREENPRRSALERALALDPTFDRVRFSLVDYHLDRFSNRTRASEILAPALHRPKRAPAALELARRIESSRVGTELSNRWQDALEEGLATELRTPVRLRKIRELRGRGLIEPALALLDQGLTFSPLEDPLLMLRAEIATATGDLETTRRILHHRRDARPVSVDAWRAIAAFERATDRHAEALAAIEGALRIAPQDESLHVERGHLLHELGRDAGALEAWGIALTLEPNQPKLRTLTEYLETSAPGIDGEFRIDMADRIARALREGPEGEDAYRILLDNRASDVQDDGTAVRYVQRVMQVLTDAGIRQLDFHVVPYAHGEQWVRVLKARVHHSDGSVNDARIRNREPEVREGEYPVWSRAFVDLPPLQVGDIVELEYLQEDLRQSFFGDYFGEETLFGGFLPREETVYTVRFPTERTLYHRGHGIDDPEVSQAGDRTMWRWRSTASNKIEPEPAGPPIEDLVPRVEVSSYATWDEFASWYHHLIRKQFESSPEIRAKVAELTEGLVDDAAKVRAVYEFVANEVRYIAWEFGVHGFLPYNADTIFTRRFGDCKDKATLICTMLDEVGIEAWPVLINGTMQRPNEDLSLPLVSHFNHCIAYVPEIEGGLFIDGTAENHGVRQLPEMDYGAEIVVVRDDGAERHQIPWNSPDDLAVFEASKVKIEEDGSAAIEQKNTFSGGYATMVRDRFEVESKRVELIEQMLSGRYPGLTVKKVETSDLDDLSAPVTLALTLEVPRYADLGGTSVELPPIRDLFSTLDGIGNTASRDDRTQDLVLGNPRGGSLRLEIEVPEGYRVGSLPESLELVDDRVRCTFRFSHEEGRIVIERNYALITPRIPPEDYESFKSIVDAVEAKLEERIVLEPGTEVN